MIDIHLISWNRPKMTELVIRTIHRNTKGPFRLIVLDNASEQSTVEMLEGLYEEGLIHEFIPIKTNLGLEAARNLLLRDCTQSDYFVCVDNDCLPQKGWLEKLTSLMESHEDYAAIALRTQVMIGTGNIFAEADEHDDLLVDFPHPGGSFRMMNTKLVQWVGGWYNETPGRGQEEKHICGKLHQAGFKTAFSVKINCLHLFGGKDTDRWGYDKDLKPEDTGHSDIDHPALINGDDYDEVAKYAGKELANDYMHNT